MKTYNDLLNEFNTLPYNKEVIDIYKEFSELELMEVYISNKLYLKEYQDIECNEILLESVINNIQSVLNTLGEKIFDFIMKILKLLKDGLNTLINWVDKNFNNNVKFSNSQYDMNAFLQEYNIAKKKINTLSFISDTKLKKVVQDGFVKILYNVDSKNNILDFFKEDLDPNNSNNISTKWSSYYNLMKNLCDKEYLINFYIDTKPNKTSNTFLCMDINKFIELCKYINKNMKITDNDILLYKYLYFDLKTNINVKDINEFMKKNEERIKYNTGLPRKIVSFLFYKNIISYFNENHKNIVYPKIIEFSKFLKQFEVIIPISKDLSKNLNKEINLISEKIESLVEEINEKIKNKKYIDFLEKSSAKFKSISINSISNRQIMDIIKIYWEISYNILSIMDAGFKISVILMDIVTKSIKK